MRIAMRGFVISSFLVISSFRRLDADQRTRLPEVPPASIRFQKGLRVVRRRTRLVIAIWQSAISRVHWTLVSKALNRHQVAGDLLELRRLKPIAEPFDQQ